MKHIYKLENMILSHLHTAPRLPAKASKWIAHNIWWIVLIGVILGILKLVFGVFLTFLASIALVSFFGAFGTAVSGLLGMTIILFSAVSLVELVLSIMAVAPLKAKRRKGWLILFIINLIEAAALLLTFLFTMDFLGFLWGILFTGLALYFLFEIRGYFTPVPSKKHK